MILRLRSSTAGRSTIPHAEAGDRDGACARLRL